MNNTIKSDLYRYGGLKGKKGFLKGLFIEGFRYTFLLRKCSVHKKYSFSGLFYRLLLNRYSHKYGFQIYPSTQIGKGFYIGHFGSLVINPNANIGENCNVAHNVTIGQTNRGKNKGCPTIGDNVWIGTGSVIVGNIIIGSNVLIAPNSYVNFDVPCNSIVMGNPAIVTSNENATADYINHTV